MSDPTNVASGAAAFVPGGGAMMGVLSAMNKSMGAESMTAMSRSADALVSSAKSGGFEVTKEAADPIIEVLNNYITEVDTMKGELRVLEQAPPLGDHPYGKKVAQHMWEAANDDRSARAALDRLQDVLTQSRDALLHASNQYQEQEESARDVFQIKGD
ncbi:hypothetical protein [Saccharomonospora azurea]|uniref:hypothetical protein n=1 Tax=Saccharomonospora azurea TaxID=40988 RepID=UPI003D8AC476